MAFPWQMMYQNPPREQALIVWDGAVPSTTSNWRLWNNTAIDLVVASIWYDYDPGGGGIFNLYLDDTQFWAGFHAPNPAFIDSGWSGPVANRTFLARAANIELTIQHGGTVSQFGLFDIIVSFTNGWQVRGENPNYIP